MDIDGRLGYIIEIIWTNHSFQKTFFGARDKKLKDIFLTYIEFIKNNFLTRSINHDGNNIAFTYLSF